ncbi:hypothetical protein Cantr_06006 [Candida viswanathii]|uniref:Uncharacterized protein n=1 Tax=Candida viswanathii TaxID=5486 RepID=A0A367XSD8_9ASCO|nr:hypothetical protein Cantr_06006 [Candida viswanathii]
MSRRSNDPTKSLRFLQISKLMRAFKPVTINGSPSRTIIKEVKDKETAEPEYFKCYKNHARLSYLQKYLLEFMRHQPEESIYLSLVVKPSDPEFPYDLEKLKINLTIPSKFPEDKTQRPRIVVLNDEIPRGFAVNIEIGFNRIVDLAQGVIKDDEIELVEGIGLTSMILTLDKHLELFLKQEKKDTIKFVKSKKKPEKAKPAPPAPKPEPKQQPQPTQKPKPRVTPQMREHRQQLIDEMCFKLQESVRLFRDENYKVTIPVLQDSVPELWKQNGSVDLMLHIPESYPQLPLGISFKNNFNENLVIKFCKEDQFEMVKIIKKYKMYEKNISANVRQYDFGSDSLLVILNWLTNNLDKFIEDQELFREDVAHPIAV